MERHSTSWTTREKPLGPAERRFEQPFHILCHDSMACVLAKSNLVAV
jgi:hypothetical protein